jgi:hypothetical protein
MLLDISLPMYVGNPRYWPPWLSAFRTNNLHNGSLKLSWCVLTKKDRGLVSVDYLPGGCLIATTIFALAVVIQWPPWGAGNHRWITNGSLTAPGLNPESKSFFFCIMDKCRETQRI